MPNMLDVDYLEEYDFFGTLLNTEDFVAGLVAMGFARKRGDEIWTALYGFGGSISGRVIANIDYGEGTVGEVFKKGRNQNAALMSAVVQAGLMKAFQRVGFMSAFEKAAATQVIAKCVGKKISSLSAALKK
jgi:hypothetical protein